MKRLLGIVVAMALLLSLPAAVTSQGVPISGLPVNPAPAGADVWVAVHNGVTMQQAARTYNTVFVDLLNPQSIGGNKTFIGTTTFTGPIVGLPATPTPAPTPTCATSACSFTGSVLTIAPGPPTPTPVPQPTCVNANCSFSSFTLTVASKPIYFYSYLPSALTATAGPWVPSTLNETALTAVADQVLCSTPGSSGTNTVKWQYTTVADPYTGSPPVTDITNSSMSWTTAGGTAPSAFTGVNLTTAAATYFRPLVTAVGIGAPSNCTFVLHGTH